MDHGDIGCSRDSVGVAVVNDRMPRFQTTEQVRANCRTVADMIGGSQDHAVDADRGMVSR